MIDDLCYIRTEQKVSEKEVIKMTDDMDMIYFMSEAKRRLVREKS